jgi:tRNA pseudouridine38-40 synthase
MAQCMGGAVHACGPADLPSSVVPAPVRLPDDVAVTACLEVPHTYHPQEHVQRKLYSYTILHGFRRALGRQHAWFVGAKPLDVAAMRVAALAFVGTHDFSSFSHSTRGKGLAAQREAAKWAAKGYSHSHTAAVAGDGTPATASVDTATATATSGRDDDDGESCDNVRTMFRVDVLEVEAGKLVVNLEATSFTRGMARNIVGCLVSVGQGKLASGCVPDVMAATDRAFAGSGAPAQGLCLEWIRYDSDV